jgi:hypothetical protein
MTGGRDLEARRARPTCHWTMARAEHPATMRAKAPWSDVCHPCSGSGPVSGPRTPMGWVATEAENENRSYGHAVSVPLQGFRATPKLKQRHRRGRTGFRHADPWPEGTRPNRRLVARRYTAQASWRGGPGMASARGARGVRLTARPCLGLSRTANCTARPMSGPVRPRGR